MKEKKLELRDPQIASIDSYIRTSIVEGTALVVFVDAQKLQKHLNCCQENRLFDLKIDDSAAFSQPGIETILYIFDGIDFSNVNMEHTKELSPKKAAEIKLYFRNCHFQSGYMVGFETVICGETNKKRPILTDPKGILYISSNYIFLEDIDLTGAKGQMILKGNCVTLKGLKGGTTDLNDFDLVLSAGRRAELKDCDVDLPHFNLNCAPGSSLDIDSCPYLIAGSFQKFVRRSNPSHKQ